KRLDVNAFAGDVGEDRTVQAHATEQCIARRVNVEYQAHVCTTDLNVEDAQPIDLRGTVVRAAGLVESGNAGGNIPDHQVCEFQAGQYFRSLGKADARGKSGDGHAGHFHTAGRDGDAHTVARTQDFCAGLAHERDPPVQSEPAGIGAG